MSGVAKRFVEKNPAAISVYSLAHCVNLCLQEVARDVTCIKEGLNFAMELIQLIKLSPKRQRSVRLRRQFVHCVPLAGRYV